MSVSVGYVCTCMLEYVCMSDYAYLCMHAGRVYMRSYMCVRVQISQKIHFTCACAVLTYVTSCMHVYLYRLYMCLCMCARVCRFHRRFTVLCMCSVHMYLQHVCRSICTWYTGCICACVSACRLHRGFLVFCICSADLLKYVCMPLCIHASMYACLFMQSYIYTHTST